LLCFNLVFQSCSSIRYETVLRCRDNDDNKDWNYDDDYYDIGGDNSDDIHKLYSSNGGSDNY